MTKQEKAVIYFLIFLFVLGAAVKFYRMKTSRPKLTVESSRISAQNADIEKIIRQRQIVRINTAGCGDFSRLPGIGPALAQRIVDYRNLNGNFATCDELKKVKGIGPRKYETIKDYLSAD